MLGSLTLALLAVILLYSFSDRSASDEGFDSGCDSDLSRTVRGPLLATAYPSLEDLKQVVRISYVPMEDSTQHPEEVRLQQCTSNGQVISVLQQGISEGDMKNALDGNVFDKAAMVWDEPYVLWHRKDLLKVYVLSRRKHDHFGAGDVAFYDFAELMVSHIKAADKNNMSPSSLGEKGYLNSFNHVNAQAFVTAIFSESLADFVADIHERHNMPELITGEFTEAHLSGGVTNPVDNYVDMINNEWGQEFGKELRRQYGIDASTRWTPELLTAVLNDLQAYYSWNFGIAMHPFESTDRAVVRFSDKLNEVLGGFTPIR